MAANPRLTQTQANSAAWHKGKSLLERAIQQRLDYAFETTLGASTIPKLLESAAAQGVEVYVWYVGLGSAEQHIARVQSRVSEGGHDIPEADIRRRFTHSRLNLIRLLPVLSGLRMYDNSAEADPAKRVEPRPILVLNMERGKILGPDDLSATPSWAKPVVAAAMKLSLA
jgi:predicted ABC-type ATPase